jgi:hypothetical protein
MRSGFAERFAFEDGYSSLFIGMQTLVCPAKQASFRSEHG